MLQKQKTAASHPANARHLRNNSRKPTVKFPITYCINSALEILKSGSQGLIISFINVLMRELTPYIIFKEFI